MTSSERDLKLRAEQSELRERILRAAFNVRAQQLREARAGLDTSFRDGLLHGALACRLAVESAGVAAIERASGRVRAGDLVSGQAAIEAAYVLGIDAVRAIDALVDAATEGEAIVRASRGNR